MKVTQQREAEGAQGTQDLSRLRALSAAGLPKESAGPQAFIANRGLPRTIEIIVSLIGLVLFAPLLLVSALTVAVTTPGGAWFLQKRVGRHGRVFVLCKLRTMNASSTGPQITSDDDARITRVGRFLRKTKIDELPTLWNVLRGDMAFVGPRPEVPRYVKLEDPIWQAVLATRPGITDPVTLELRNEEGLLAELTGDREKYYVEVLQPLKLSGYLAYLEKRNWRTDLNVVLQTLAALVVSHRASGSFADRN